jgi:hypothetical protein
VVIINLEWQAKKSIEQKYLRSNNLSGWGSKETGFEVMLGCTTNGKENDELACDNRMRKIDLWIGIGCDHQYQGARLRCEIGPKYGGRRVRGVEK